MWALSVQSLSKRVGTWRLESLPPATSAWASACAHAAGASAAAWAAPAVEVQGSPLHSAEMLVVTSEVGLGHITPPNRL